MEDLPQLVAVEVPEGGGWEISAHIFFLLSTFLIVPYL